MANYDASSVQRAGQYLTKHSGELLAYGKPAHDIQGVRPDSPSAPPQ